MSECGHPRSCRRTHKATKHELTEWCSCCGALRTVFDGVASSGWESPSPARIPLFKVAMSGSQGLLHGVLRSGYIGQGPGVERLEDALHSYLECNVRPLATNSCTSAIELALRTIGVGPGDRVITTPMTCIATNAPIQTLGAEPVWADIHPDGRINPDSVEDTIRFYRDRGRDVPKAIIAVDWGGALCDYQHLKSFGLPVIQDAAHVLEPHMCRGDYTCMSFQAIKPLTTGDGGALIPRGSRERAELLRWFGLDRTKNKSFRCAQLPTEIGGKYHMNDIAAAIGLANLPLAKRNQHLAAENARYFKDHLDIPGIPRPFRASWWLCTLRVPDRDGFIEHMAAHGIECSRVHSRCDLMPGFRGSSAPRLLVNGDIRTDLPGVREFDQHQVNIPVGWWLTDTDRERIVEAVNAWK